MTTMQWLPSPVAGGIKRGASSPGAVVFVLAVLVALVASSVSGWYLLVDTVITGSMWALIAVGLSLVFGVMQVPSFVIGEYFLAGSLCSYFVMSNAGSVPGALAPVLAILAGTAAGLVTGALTDLVIFRALRRRVTENWVMNTFVITIGLSVFLQNFDQVVFGPNYKAVPAFWHGTVPILGTHVAIDQVVAGVIGLVVIGAMTYAIKFSSLGRTVRAVSQDETGARLIGIDIKRVNLVTYTASCGLAALAGAVLLPMFPSFPTVGSRPLQICWTVVILAGLGSIGGAIASGFIVALLTVMTDNYLSTGWEPVVSSIAILIILALRPRGLFSSGVRGLWEG
jgi:branched-chain amino acid transport system permease protein